MYFQSDTRSARPVSCIYSFSNFCQSMSAHLTILMEELFSEKTLALECTVSNGEFLAHAPYRHHLLVDNYKSKHLTSLRVSRNRAE